MRTRYSDLAYAGGDSAQSFSSQRQRPSQSQPHATAPQQDPPQPPEQWQSWEPYGHGRIIHPRMQPRDEIRGGGVVSLAPPERHPHSSRPHHTDSRQPKPDDKVESPAGYSVLHKMVEILKCNRPMTLLGYMGMLHSSGLTAAVISRAVPLVFG